MTMPSEAKYQQMLGVLRKQTESVASTDDNKARLDAGVEALRAVVVYLVSDPEVAREFLTQPLAIIENAVFDKGRGKSVALLEHAPTREGPPAGTKREETQGSMAFALDLLAKSGRGTKNAAAWLAQEAKKLGLRCEGGALIQPRQVINWRSEISRGKAPALARKAFEEDRQFDPTLLQGPRSEVQRARCERAVRNIIKSLVAIAPQLAPKPTRRLKE
jgi:hypothetical protein